jgi:succinate dehydrogenase/fumarate reductase flavoprotein subunit
MNNKVSPENDIVIVVAGTAGLSAAVAAAESGTNVAVFFYDYPMMLPATTMGFCINSGRMAEDNDIEYLKHGI